MSRLCVPLEPKPALRLVPLGLKKHEMKEGRRNEVAGVQTP